MVGDARETASLRLPVILNAYNFRNETTFLDAQTPVWGKSSQSSEFVFHARAHPHLAAGALPARLPRAV